MAFSFHQGGVVMSSPITRAQSPTIHPLAHILGSCAFISVVEPFLQFIPTPSWNGIPPLSRCISTQKEHRNHAKMAAWNSIIYIRTRALHSFLSLAHRRAASTVIPLLPKATFTPSIQPNLRLPRTRPPLTSAINTLLANRRSSIPSTCPNYLNTLWSTLLVVIILQSSNNCIIYFSQRIGFASLILFWP